MELGGQKQRAVLALLLIDAGRVVSTDRLIDALWGESPPRTAPTSLQNFVSQLRKLLGPELVITKPPGYLLRIEPRQLDVNRARGCSPRRSRAAGREGGQAPAALALWRGAPLADFPFESFAQGEIARLEELRLTMLEERIDAELEAGRPRRSSASWRRSSPSIRCASGSRAADARALPLRPAGRGARGLPGRSARARRRARDRAEPAAPAAARRDPAPGDPLEPARAARRRTTSRTWPERCSRAGSSPSSAPTSAS